MIADFTVPHVTVLLDYDHRTQPKGRASDQRTVTIGDNAEGVVAGLCPAGTGAKPRHHTSLSAPQRFSTATYFCG